jgi:hypothetical protein
MFVPKPVLILAILFLAVFVALYAARPTRSAGPETRYVVQPGDTLWGLAAERFAGDPREGIWRIRERNDLDGTVLPAGTILYLPARAGGA